MFTFGEFWGSLGTSIFEKYYLIQTTFQTIFPFLINMEQLSVDVSILRRIYFFNYSTYSCFSDFKTIA